MGNINTFSDLVIDTFHTSDLTTSPSSSQINDHRSLQSASRKNKIICEYCQEYNFEHFHDQHIRICPCNPDNLQVSKGFNFRQDTLNTSLNLTSELSKIPCEFCHEMCYVKFQDNHKRICAKNPDNIRINCEKCFRTLSLVKYEEHLRLCEESQQRRRRSNSPVRSEGAMSRPMLQEFRKTKSNNELIIEQSTRQESKTVCKDVASDCPICLEGLKSKFETSALTCGHKFHRHCINNWSRRQRRCPICRKDFY